MTKLSYDEIRSRVLERLKSLNINFSDYYVDVNEIANELASRLKVGNQDHFRVKSNTDDQSFEKIRDLLFTEQNCTFLAEPSGLSFDFKFDNLNDGLYELEIEAFGWINRGDSYIKLDGRCAKVVTEADIFDSSYLIDFLANLYSCKIEELASVLIEDRMQSYIDVDLSSADESDERSAREWFMTNVSNRDLLYLIRGSHKIYDDYYLVESRSLRKCTIDLSDCLQPRLSADTSKVIKKINQFIKKRNLQWQI